VYTFDYFWQVLGKKTPTPEVRGALDLTDVPGPPGWGRVLGLRMLYPASGRWGLGSSFDRDNLGLHSAHMRALVTLFRNAEETPAYARLLARAGVRYVLALHAEGLEDLDEIAAVASPFPLPIRIFRVRDPLPQAFVVGRGRLAVGEASLAALAGADFDPTREVLLEQGEALASDEFSGSVAIVTLLPDRLVADVQLSQPGYLVTTDGYDPGWKASVDGRPASLLRANVAFRAVPVPAGTHRMEQVYRPRSVSAGLAISGLALLAGVAIASRAARASLRR
jgi:hypothetical protein